MAFNRVEPIVHSAGDSRTSVRGTVFTLLGACVCLLICACPNTTKPTSNKSQSGQPLATQVPSEAEVRKRFVPGATEEEITRTFGKPAHVDKMDDTTSNWMYLLEPDSVPSGPSVFSGFIIVFETSRASDFLPITMSNPAARSGEKEGDQ